ncbi:anaerobic sulfatase maturase [Deltaproteobacteria bacterium Smac51]|nr:anaerobic sulfatase maturase [Deltaproteobacteria bacterium Smac51]
MAKPSGPDCNLDCAYCFYREKETFYGQAQRHRMSDAMLENYVRQYIESSSEGELVPFTWQGGEPTLNGLDFYRRAVALQTRYAQGRPISNSFQTNGVLIDEAWAAFFKEHNFLIGLSLDGPADIHDACRPTVSGRSSHAAVERALKLLQRHGVDYNALACVGRLSSRDPLRVYEYLREAGVEFIQFIPIVERRPELDEAAQGLKLHGPGGRASGEEVTDWSVRPQDYGLFLNCIFDYWVKNDVGRTFVMNFEWALANFMGRPGTVCHHQPTCGRSVVVEHNGDVYACDHYVYPEYRLGNLAGQSFTAMLDAPAQEEFGRNKYSTLSDQCRKCKVLKGCWGGCPKHRFTTNAQGEAVNYLCPGLFDFFGHLSPYLRALADLINSGRPASDIMEAKLMFVSWK